MDNNKQPTALESARRYAGDSLNTAFNDFLHIDPADLELLARHHPALRQGAERFAEIFYAYLLNSPATAEVLESYRAGGGKIDHLVKKQLQHLYELVEGHTDEEYARNMERIGELHYRYRIEPVWIMGAYLLYLEHLQGLIRANPSIPATERESLDAAVTKFLFRDMGLMLEGYRDAAARALRQEQNKVGGLQQQITSLLSNIPQLLWSVDVVHNRPLYVSPSARELCEPDIDMPIPCLGWTIPEDRETVRLAWQRALLGHKVEVESRVHQPNGTQRWFRRIFYPFTDASGKVVRMDGLMEDTTNAKFMVQRLHTLATTDNLTGLPNRALFNDRLMQAITAASRDTGKQVVVMLMDLDHFKEINDTLGHPTGDQVLILVAQRLRAALRDSDTVARLGGDEFAILLPDVKDVAQDGGESDARGAAIVHRAVRVRRQRSLPRRRPGRGGLPGARRGRGHPHEPRRHRHVRDQEQGRRLPVLRRGARSQRPAAAAAGRRPAPRAGARRAGAALSTED